MIPAHTCVALEFHRITEILSGLCRSPAGRERALALHPLPDKEAASEAAQLYEEACLCFSASLSDGESGFSPVSFPDTSSLLRGVERSGATLRERPDTEAFWALREMLLLANRANCAITTNNAQNLWPNLLNLAQAAPLPVQFTHALSRCISDDARIKDESSPELYRLRNELRTLHKSCMRKVKEFALRYNISLYLQDDFMTLSSDRYVLPLKADFKGHLQGIIHDWSQTGETCYFEPLFLLEINNRLQELKHEEHEEELQILKYLLDLLIAELPGVRAAQELLTQLDVLQAKSRLAARFDGRCVPLTQPEEGIKLHGARHPLLALSEHKNAVRPLDITLRPGERILIVTGGNAGGKTVCLKTLGLIALMAQCGLPLPVEAGSRLPWFDRIEAFIGDEQSLEDNVSTFTAQIEHLAKVWEYLDPGDLVLLDEFGAGTDPTEGVSLARAVIDELLNMHIYVLAATHFPSLKLYAMSCEHARAASMLFDPESKKPLFRLAYDQVGASHALDVAQEHGLPESIMVRARRYLLEDNRDVTALLDQLNALAAKKEEELAQTRAEREAARRDTQKLREQLKKERERLSEEIRDKATTLLKAWKEGRIAGKQAFREMSRLRASLHPATAMPEQGETPHLALLTVGQSILHKSFNNQGVITDIDKRRQRIRVIMNGVSLWARLEDIALDRNAKTMSGST
ncbi:MAG: endonuclease MutS2 [Desulfovibrio sp.]|jgi:DNA mismatch repair protein MutS2|nr:endonuclease MutS2 [Desulfovibrio sp.]